MALTERILVMKKIIAVLSVAALISSLSAASFAATGIKVEKPKTQAVQKILHKHEKKTVTGQKTGGAAPVKPVVKKEVKKTVKKSK